MFLFVFTSALICVGATASHSETSKTRDRAAFVRKLMSIRDGTTEKQVIALLGKPDDVVTFHTPGFHAYDHILAYGTDGHLTLPTLGCVYIEGHVVNHTSVRVGSQPPRGMFAEPELRRLFRVIDRSRLMDGPNGNPSIPTAVSREFGFGGYSPITIITIVNTLIPLGKTKALAILDAYRQIVSNHSLVLIIRLLFDQPVERGPMWMLGLGPSRAARPDDLYAIVRFPYVLVDDVPLLIDSTDRVWGGWTAPPDILYFKKHGRFRRHPLQPKGDPLEIPGKFAAMAVWHVRQFDDFHTLHDPADEAFDRLKLVMDQVIWMVGSRQDIRNHLNDAPGTPQSLVQQWRALTTDLARQRFRWNTKAQRYVATSGMGHR